MTYITYNKVMTYITYKEGKRLGAMKKRFNTNIREDKLIELKKMALDEGLGANDLIEKMIDIYSAIKQNPDDLKKILEKK